MKKLLFTVVLCFALYFCGFIGRVQETYCSTTNITTSICACSTTTTVLPAPEFCGETIGNGIYCYSMKLDRLLSVFYIICWYIVIKFILLKGVE